MAELPPGYPDRLLCKGRPVDRQFSPTEKLYFRLPPLQSDEDEVDFVPAGKVPPIPSSFNRSKYSKAKDVIVGRPDHGIAQLFVQDVPNELESVSGTRLQLRVEHDPLDKETVDNYAHTEIRIYRDGVLLSSNDIDKRDRFAYRDLISRKAKLYRRPKRKADA